MLRIERVCRHQIKTLKNTHTHKKKQKQKQNKTKKKKKKKNNTYIQLLKGCI